MLGLLALPMAQPLSARAQGGPPAPIGFRIIREGSDIGSHTVRFQQAGGTLSALTEVAIAVRLMGITVFRYSHRFEESWADGRLREARSRLDRNGTVTEMQARAVIGGIQVQGPEGALRLPAEAAPLSWWDASRYAAPLFDNAKGSLLRLSLQREALPDGGQRWRVGGEEDATAGYDAAGRWRDYTTKGDDGSTVVYRRA